MAGVGEVQVSSGRSMSDCNIPFLRGYKGLFGDEKLLENFVGYPLDK